MAYQPMYNAYAGVPYGYPGYYPQTTAPMGQQTTYQQPINGLVSVTGIDGAKAYQLPPNSSMPLFDNGSDVLYVKTTDGAGFPTIRTYRFEPMGQEQLASVDYVPRSEFEALVEQVGALAAGAAKPAARAGKAASDGE